MITHNYASILGWFLGLLITSCSLLYFPGLCSFKEMWDREKKGKIGLDEKLFAGGGT